MNPKIKDAVIILCALGGVGVIMVYALSEAIHHTGLRIGNCITTPDTGFPWGTLIAAAVLVAPLTIGAAAAGNVWTSIANMLPGKKGE